MPPKLDSLGRPKPVQTIKCVYCPKVFKRSEHCARHELSHTNERPFSCQFCHRKYARKDLVKRHERTIHVDLYNALTESENLRNPAATSEPSNLGQGPARLEADSRTDQVSDHDTHFGDVSLVSDEVLQAPDRTSSDSRKRASFETCTSTQENALDTASCTQPLPIFLTNDSDSLGHSNLGSANAAHEDNSAADTQNLEPPPPLVPCSNHERSRITTVDILTPSCFDSFAAPDNHMDILEPPRKRHRPCDDEPSGQVDQSNRMILGSAAISSFGDDGENLFLPSDLGILALPTEDVSDDFFLQQLVQQHDRFIGTLGHGDFSIVDSYQLPWPKPASIGSSVGHSSDSKSENGTDISGQKRVPIIIKEKFQNLPHLAIDEVAFWAFSSDVDHRLGTVGIDPVVKNRRELQHFLNGYLGYFHRHLPVVHLPSLDVSRTPSPLILAMCCIGALYRLERQKARDIYFKATDILETMSSTPNRSSLDAGAISTRSPENHLSAQTTKSKPLWCMQARFLLMLYAILSSDTAIMQAELGRMGTLMTDYRTRRAELRIRSEQHRELQWHDWIDMEATKRILCANFILSSLLTILYDFPPGFSITRDLEIELLDEERLWNAPTAEAWRELRGKDPASPTRTIRDVMEDMLSGKTDNSSDGNNSDKNSVYYVSAFTSLVIIHGATVYAWNLSQFSHVHFAPFRDLSGVGMNTLLTNATATLTRCGEILQLARSEGIEPFWNSPEGPLLLNCETVLRVAYSRLFLKASMPEGVMLFLSDPQDHVRLLVDFVAAPQERSPLITKVMTSMYEAFSVPSKAGYLLVQKTASIHWSVEHAIAGWNCVFLLSKWLHSLELLPDDTVAASAELDIVSQVKTALEGMDTDYDGTGSLAAAVVASWAPLMTDVCVWGVTMKMGAILLDLAQVYKTSFKNAMRQRAKG